jgi:hypothetical protein
VPRAGEETPPPQAPPNASATEESGLTEDELLDRMDQLREQLARTPSAVVVAQVAYQLFEVAALHLSLQPPQLDEARLAIDAMAAIVETLGDRLGENAGPLRDGLTQIRLAFVQVQKGEPLTAEE